MFQPRQLFHRPGSTVKVIPNAPNKVEESNRESERHPAMRGLQVSPVHGRHCICGRCEQRSNAA